MNRTLLTAVAAAFAVALYSAVSFASESVNTPPPSTPKTGKDIYRTQYKGGFVMPPPVVPPQLAPRQTEATLSEDNSFGKGRRTAQPVFSNKTEQPGFVPDVILPGETVVLPYNNSPYNNSPYNSRPYNSRSGVIISDRRADEPSPGKVINDRMLQYPLSGIDVPKKPDTLKLGTVKTGTAKPKPTGEKPWTSPVAEAEKNNDASVPISTMPPKPVLSSIADQKRQLDDFNSRLAKIQLEKKNLTAVLSLIEKIKSPEFKVKSLVDLAEYVSRDSNYKKEADTLYELAVAGIDALNAGKPVVVVKLPEKSGTVKELDKESNLTDTPLEVEIKLPEIRQIPQIPSAEEDKPELKPTTPRKPLILIEEPEKPLTEKPQLEKPQLENQLEKPPLEKPQPEQVLPKPEEKKKLTLIEETEELPQPTLAPPSQKPAETKPVEVKPAEEKPAETKPADVEPVEEKPAEEKPIEEKPAETMPTEVKPVDEKPAEEKPVEEKPAETMLTEEKPAEAKSVEEKPAESALEIAPTRKPMPKRRILVTD